MTTRDATPKRSTAISTGALWLLAAITLLGLGLRFYHLDAQSVWYDEAFTVTHAAKPFAPMMEALIDDAVHPPLHYILVHEWFAWIGYGPWHARMNSVIFGTTAIPILFLLTRRFATTQTALIAALLLAISQVEVYFSQEARAYQQTMFLTLLAALLMLRMLERPSWRNIAGFTLAGTLLTYSHYYGAVTLASFGVYGLLFHRHQRRAIWSLIGAGAAITVLLLPWLRLLSASSGGGADFWSKARNPHWFAFFSILNQFANGKFGSLNASSATLQVLGVLALFGLPVLVAGFHLLRHRSKAGRDPETQRAGRGFTLGALMLLFPVVTSIGLSYFGVFYQYRHASFAAPGMYMAVAIATQLGFSRKLTLLWTGATVAVALVALRANYFAPTKPDYRTAFAPMAAEVQNGDCLAQRPAVWEIPEPHYGLTSYHPETANKLRMVPWDQFPQGAVGCERLWMVWDRAFGAQAEDVNQETRTRIEDLEQRWRLSAQFSHPAVEIWRFTVAPDGQAVNEVPVAP